MDEPSTIAKLNIEHYRRLLATESDPKRRETRDGLPQSKIVALPAPCLD